VQAVAPGRGADTDKVGSVHDMRFVFFDNDTKLLFASTYDGDWETYINDFATLIPDALDLVFSRVGPESARRRRRITSRSINRHGWAA
jgi:hypothetical protein